MHTVVACTIARSCSADVPATRGPSDHAYQRAQSAPEDSACGSVPGRVAAGIRKAGRRPIPKRSAGLSEQRGLQEPDRPSGRSRPEDGCMAGCHPMPAAHHLSKPAQPQRRQALDVAADGISTWLSTESVDAKTPPKRSSAERRCTPRGRSPRRLHRAAALRWIAAISQDGRAADPDPQLSVSKPI
jgi:hypothetical protein